MAQCDKRLNAVFLALIKYSIIECETFLIRLFIIAVRENAAPVDGEAEAFESHLSEESNVFLKMMVEVDCFMRRIKYAFFYGRTKCSRCINVAAEKHIRNGKPLSAFKITAFALIAGDCSAP